MFKKPAAILAWQPRSSLPHYYGGHLQRDERDLADMSNRFGHVHLASVHLHANKNLPRYHRRTG